MVHDLSGIVWNIMQLLLIIHYFLLSFFSVCDFSDCVFLECISKITRPTPVGLLLTAEQGSSRISDLEPDMNPSGSEPCALLLSPHAYLAFFYKAQGQFYTGQIPRWENYECSVKLYIKLFTVMTNVKIKVH